MRMLWMRPWRAQACVSGCQPPVIVQQTVSLQARGLINTYPGTPVRLCLIFLMVAGEKLCSLRHVKFKYVQSTCTVYILLNSVLAYFMPTCCVYRCIVCTVHTYVPVSWIRLFSAPASVFKSFCFGAGSGYG
jgi:hypothetical protein